MGLVGNGGERGRERGAGELPPANDGRVGLRADAQGEAPQNPRSWRRLLAACGAEGRGDGVWDQWRGSGSTQGDVAAFLWRGVGRRGAGNGGIDDHGRCRKMPQNGCQGLDVAADVVYPCEV